MRTDKKVPPTAWGNFLSFFNKPVDLRHFKQNGSSYHRKNHFGEHICAVVKRTVKPLVVGGKGFPYHARGVENYRAAYYVENVTDKHRKSRPRKSAAKTLLAKDTADTYNSERSYVVQENTRDKHYGSKPPAQKSVNGNALPKLNKRIHERCEKSRLNSPLNAENNNRQH